MNCYFNEKEQQLKSCLQRISNILLINGGFLDNPGLYTGEMGLVLFFFHYARYTQNTLFLDYGYDLIDKIQNRIHQETSIDYKQGLAGIGSAFEYLAQKKIIEVDTGELLEDFDDQIFSIQNIHDLSLEEIVSIAYYAIWRISERNSNKKYLLKTILPQVVNAIDEWQSIHGLTHPEIDFLKNIIKSESTNFLRESVTNIPAWDRLYNKDSQGVYISELSQHCREIMSNNDIFRTNTIELGLRNGLAGMGMSLLTELDENVGVSWTSLILNNFIQKKNEPLLV